MHRSGGPGAALAAALTMLLLAVAAPAQGAFSGQNGRLAFERDGSIWTMNPDGSDPQRVALSASGSFSDPSWSPDGRRIVFESGSGTISAVDLTSAGNVVRNLTALHSAGAREDPEFLPNGQIVYIEKLVGPERRHLYRMEADGTSPTDLTPTYNDFLATPASNSAGALYVFCGSAEKDICQAGLGGGLTNITNTPFPVSEGYPDVAPGGAVLFTRCCGTDSGLWAGASRLAGGPSDPKGQAGPGAWSPDGTKIAFLSDSATHLWIMNADGSNKTQITGAPTSNLFEVTEVDWGPVATDAGTGTPGPAPGPGTTTTQPPVLPAASQPTKPVSLAKPILTGTARVGRTLRCRPGRFGNATRVTTAWLRAGKPIKGARRTTYTPARRDTGKAISCRSTATGPGGTTTSTSKRLLVRR